MFTDYKEFKLFLNETFNITEEEIGLKCINDSIKGVCFELTDSGSCFFVISANVFNHAQDVFVSFKIELDTDILSDENNMSNSEFIDELSRSHIERRLLFENNFEKAVYEK